MQETLRHRGTGILMMIAGLGFVLFSLTADSILPDSFLSSFAFQALEFMLGGLLIYAGFSRRFSWAIR